MDPLTAFGLAASILSVISCACTAIILTREWNRRIEFAMELSDVHQHEIEVLQTVIQECRKIAISATQVPSSINEAFRTCASREKNLLQALMHMNGASSAVTKTLRLSVQNIDIQRHYSMFRESVLLLRDLCSELRTQLQLVDMGAGMARLASDFFDEDDETDGQEPVHPAAMTKDNDKPRPMSTKARLISALEQLGNSNYVINATVVVEQPSGEKGQRFKYVSAKAEHTPALVKLDTGSDVDVVSQEFLVEAGFAANAFMPIPEEAKDSFVGIGGTPYQPKSTIELFWFREGEQRIRKTRFFVVSGAHVDLLLGSRQFAQEAAKRVALFTGPPKSKATLKLEQQREVERLLEATQAEEKRFQEALRKRQAQPRNLLPHISFSTTPDLEKNSTTSVSRTPQSGRS